MQLLFSSVDINVLITKKAQIIAFLAADNIHFSVEISGNGLFSPQGVGVRQRAIADRAQGSQTFV
jgi:hypothetical protein